MSGREHEVVVFSYGTEWQWECNACSAKSPIGWPLDQVYNCLDDADQHRCESAADDGPKDAA